MELERKAKKLAELLSKPVSDYAGTPVSVTTSKKVERVGDSLNVTVPEAVLEGTAADFLTAEGLDPTEWEVTKFSKSEWAGDKKSTRFEFKKRAGTANYAALTDSELDKLLTAPLTPAAVTATGMETALLALGDMQAGKWENPAADVVERVAHVIREAKEQIAQSDGLYGDIVVAWLGDHIEGFESQGGANAWRTPMPLTEQIRLTRRLMMFAMQELATLGLPLRMVAVPGNHGDAKRFGKGVTTYDDNHDTEALLAVMDAAKLSDAYKHVEFYVPKTDELSVSLDLSGTHVVFTHGHMGGTVKKLMDWVMKQAFNRHSVYASCDLVVTGHFHHLYIETSTDRTLIVAPALETESTWYRHHAGVGGCPGALLIDVGNGAVHNIQIIKVK